MKLYKFEMIWRRIGQVIRLKKDINLSEFLKYHYIYIYIYIYKCTPDYPTHLIPLRAGLSKNREKDSRTSSEIWLTYNTYRSELRKQILILFFKSILQVLVRTKGPTIMIIARLKIWTTKNAANVVMANGRGCLRDPF